MSLQCGIVGLPNVGKSTLFNALTKAGIAAENYPFCTIEPNVGVVEVPDPRLKQLAAIDKPQKVIPLCLAGDLQGAMLKLHTQDKPEKPAERTGAAAPAPNPGKP